MIDKTQKIKELVEKLNQYRNSYYNESISEVSDYEYDCLFDELEQLEKDTGIILSNSPTQTVGYEVKSELEKVKHSHPMLSLGKTKSSEDLVKFSNGRDCIISLKMDGLTILNTYDNGKLIQSETRGNGEVGELITHNAKVFDNLPTTIPCDKKFEIEGEAIITYETFEKINANIKDEDSKYKNPRNLASGSVRQLDSSIAKDRHVRFVAWKIPFGLTTYSLGFEIAEKWGFEVVPYVKYNSLKDDINEKIEELKNIAKEKSYPIDGLVITYDNIEYGKSLGMTGHHPKHSLAFKFYDEEIETTLVDIEWSMGKTGTLCPVAIFEPVEIDGTEVSRASVHNWSMVQELELGIGDIITVYKANAIIPQIADNFTRSGNVTFPDECPICGGLTKIVKDKDTKVVVCDNPNCKGKMLGKLTHFCSRDCMNIDGLSEQTLTALLNWKYIKTFKDIYHLSDYKKDISALPKQGARSVAKLLTAIENSRKTDLAHLLAALSIPFVGKSTAKVISKYCHDSVDEFIFIMNNTSLEFASIDGIGTAVVESLDNWWNDNSDMFYELLEELEIIVEEKEVVVGADLTGMTFVITGSLNHFNNRDELKDKLESLGAKISGSVTSKTTALICNDKDSNTGKSKKAKDLNIPIWSEEELLAKL